MQVQQALTRHTGVSSPVSAADRAEVRCARQPAPRASGAHRDRSHTDQGCPETVLERAISTQGPASGDSYVWNFLPFQAGDRKHKQLWAGKVQSSDEAGPERPAARGRAP